jgi:hypothetical protein
MTSLLQEQQKLSEDGQPLSTDKPQPQDFDFSKVQRNKNARAIE